MLDQKTLFRLRREMPILGRYLCLNWGHSGPSPRPVLGAIERVLKMESRHGPFHPSVRARQDSLLSEVRSLLGKVIGAGGEEMALSDNTTAGVNLIARSLDWRPGDEIILSKEEHPGGYLPWLIWRDRCGVKLRLINVEGDDDHFLSALKRSLSRRTRLICLSHVSWLSGYLFPVQKVAEMARDRGVYLLVDGAQAVGQRKVDVKRIGCDFYALSGQKWLLGPQGTGSLYVRGELLDSPPLSGAGFNSAASKDLARGTYSLHPDARRFELATLSTALFAGLGRAIEETLKVGLGPIEARVKALSSRLLHALEDVPELEVLTKRRNGRAPSGLVTVRMEGLSARELVESLFRRERALVREVPAEPPAVRISLHYLNLEEEVDRLAEALIRIASRKRPGAPSPPGMARVRITP